MSAKHQPQLFHGIVTVSRASLRCPNTSRIESNIVAHCVSLTKTNIAHFVLAWALFCTIAAEICSMVLPLPISSVRINSEIFNI
jgi:hypothetical protein